MEAALSTSFLFPVRVIQQGISSPPCTSGERRRFPATSHSIFPPWARKCHNTLLSSLGKCPTVRLGSSLVASAPFGLSCSVTVDDVIHCGLWHPKRSGCLLVRALRIAMVLSHFESPFRRVRSLELRRTSRLVGKKGDVVINV